MKPRSLDLGGGMIVHEVNYAGELWYAALRNGGAVFCPTPAALRKHLRLPPKTPSRDSLDSWLDAPALRAVEAPAEPQGLDPSDPNHNTRTVI